ncbi:RICIN domain-containing protein [Paenibacillus sp. IB182496]|uniref:RICIN domain-containing protein n=1 Tax=Paenibacillus sabuli TaxID=2772509 RepID=A0A927BN68_9BACL|nr:RICIN domain-containing protein [Paenibacillus sabuli]MBD2843628.1 RICIN domain-containing protein [Paenibacillus sabuli]
MNRLIGGRLRKRISQALAGLLLGLFLIGNVSATNVNADEKPATGGLVATVDWNTLGKTIAPYAYGLNANGFLQSTYTENPDFMANIRYLNGNKGLIRIHSTGMISTAGWLNEDLTWNESRIAGALAPLVQEDYPIMINIPYGPAGKTDYLDADAFAVFAAELVEIVNVDHGLDVRYWEIPNERESGFASPGLSASAMAELIAKSALAMKAVDPSILVGGPATSDVNVPYLSDVIDLALPSLDFVSMHAYSSGQSRPGTDVQAYNHAQNQGALASALRAEIETNHPGAELPIVIDEYNMTWDTDPRLHTSKESVYTALLAANVVGGDGTAVNFWHAEGSYMGLMNDRHELYETADLHHWLNRFFHGQTVATAFEDETKVDGFAVASDDRKSMMLINRTDDVQTVELNQSGTAPGTWQLYRLDASGSSHTPNLNAASWAADGLELPGHSVTVLTSGAEATPVEHIPYTLTNGQSETLLTATGSVYGYVHGPNTLSWDQQWTFRAVGGGRYEIQTRGGESLLSVPYGQSEVATQWELIPLSGQRVRIQAADSSLVLAISTDPLEEEVSVEPVSTDPRQTWQMDYAGPRTHIIDHGEHLYQVINKASGKVLQIGNSRGTEGGIANLQEDEGLASQKWSFRCFDGCSGFRMINAGSKLVINGAAGSRITQAPFWYDAPRQLWTLDKQPDGAYVIRDNVTTGVLQPKDGSLLEGAMAVTAPYTGTDAQQWYIVKDERQPIEPVVDEEHDYILQNAATGQVMEVADASTANAASVTQAVYAGTPEQLWQFRWYRSGTRIVNANSGLVLAPNASQLAIQQTFAYHDVNQQWILERQPDGSYLLVYAANRKVLQPVDASGAEGIRYEWADPDGTDKQRWLVLRQ